jgi:hypothetical protein
MISSNFPAMERWTVSGYDATTAARKKKQKQFAHVARGIFCHLPENKLTTVEICQDIC